MKNNKLTAKYIKDIFRFMEIYNINHALNDLNKEHHINFHSNNGMYCINILSETKPHLKYDNFKSKDLSEVIEKIKNSKYYMMELV